MGLLLLQGASDLNPRELFASGEQGLWLDPSDMTAGKAGWRRNLLTYSEGLVAQFGLTDQVTNASTSISGFSNSIEFGNNSVVRYCYNVYTTILNASYTVSIFVQMDDDSIPSVGSSTTTGDFSLIAVNSILSGVTVSLVSGSTYRISKTFIGDGASRNIGIIKYTGQSAKTFRVTGYQLELGSLSEYQKITDFSTEFKAAFPTHTLYQDSNGVTPCTAAGDPVGLILDQSRGGLGALGPELVTNGDFASGQTGWIDSPVAPSGWSFTGGALVGSNAAGGYEQAVQVTSGKWYRCTITLSNVSGGAVSFAIAGAGAGPTFSSNGTNTVLINAGSTGNIGIVRRTSNFTGTIDNISVREVPGNHAYQTTSASRPTLARLPSSGRRNLLTRTEEFDNAAWAKSNTTASANTSETTDPLGTNTADKIFETTATGTHTVRQTVAVTSGQNITFSFYAKAAGRNFVRFWEDVTTGKQGFFDLANGTATNSDLSSVAIQSVGNGWYRCSGTINSFAGTSYGFRVHVSTDGTTTSYAGDDTKGVYLWGAQLETGSTATNYQKVVATTDVTESGVGDLWHLVFDGSDDSLVTNSVDFSATDEMTVIAGVRKLSDAAFQVVAELTPNWNTSPANNGAFLHGVADSTWLYNAGARGTQTVNANQVAKTTSATYAAPVTNVFTALHDISNDATSLRLNAADIETATGEKGSGNFANAAIYIGRRGGASSPYNGHIYQLIVRGKTTPTGKLLEAERFVARKTGVSF